ncbi:MAG: PhnD/SsuA/transferrin family substrate-binding protein [Alcaligenaceae bacterium]|nr:PhnD/SsuA/transferrin family substrate-binding protein [Alcaligenaceae bacterium]
MTVWAGALSAQSHSLASEQRTEPAPSINKINQARAEPIRIAALSYLGADRTMEEWQATIQWLTDNLPQYDFEFIPAVHDEIVEMVRTKAVDYLISNPGLYSLLHYEYGINHMLSQVYAADKLSSLSLGSTLIKRKDNHEIVTFEDLPGRSMAIVSREAFGGYRVMWRELRARNIEPEVEMQLKQVDFPMSNVLKAVASGEADTGVLRACVLESVPNWEQHFSVIEATGNPNFPCHVTTRLYPGWVFAGIENDRLVETRDIMQSLLQLPPSDSGSGEMYWSVLSNTKALNELFRELELGVFSPKGPLLVDYFKRYWWVLAGALFLVAIGGLYTARVRYLVSKRTAALEHALAQQKALQDRINEVQEQANHQAKLVILGEMSGTLAHELNQPLATIGNYSRSVLRRLDSQRLNEDDLRMATAEITEQTERASSIIQGVRAFARKRPMRLEPVNIKEVCEEAVQLISGMLSMPPSILVFDFLGASKILTVDPVQIQQALINLLKNGYDAMLEAEVKMQIIHMVLWHSEQQVHISVQDSGPGLSEEAYENLFETFYTSKKEGLGLGLSVCRTIAEAHGGKLEVDVLPSESSLKALSGATFTLSLPAQ